MSGELSQTDRSVLDLLRENQGSSVNDLVERLGVTATAVRQRLSRLSAAGLIDRTNEFGGRGRPTHRYRLTDKGELAAGSNLPDLASALWEEVQQIPDQSIRIGVMTGLIRRLSELYQDQIHGETLAERMQSVAEVFSQRQIPLTVQNQNGLPVLNVIGCPYPDLADEGHAICEMETELFSRLMGQEVTLGQCEVHGCCTFQAADRKQDSIR